MKKFLATVLVTGLFTFGCDRCPDVPRHFDIQGVQVRNASLDQALIGSHGNTVLDSVQFENFAISASYRLSFYTVSRPLSFSLLPRAYALECVEPGSAGTKEKIEKIDVIALSDFNAGYRSGTSLNQIVKINGLPVADYIADQNARTPEQSGFEIKLTQKPDSTIQQAFSVVYKLTNGEEYTAETTPITIY